MGRVEPPLAVDAELFHRRFRDGKSGALLVSARGTDQTLVECVVKVDARLMWPPTEHLREWLACAIGKRLGIPVATPYAVQLSQEFAGGVSDTSARFDVLKSLGTVFGAELFVGCTPWPTGEALPDDLRTVAAELLAFDVFIHNPDRRVVNANVMTSQGRLAVFDHGDAFAFILPDFSPDRKEPALDYLRRDVEQHVFRTPLRGGDVPLDRFYGALKTLSNEFLDGIPDATPPAWQAGSAAGKLDEMLRVLRHRRDAADEWLPKVVEVIQS